MKDKKYCAGCTDDFYNGNNELGVQGCWSFRSAKVVTRYRVGWHAPTDRQSAFTKVKTLSCHREPGRAAFYTPEQFAKVPKKPTEG